MASIKIEKNEEKKTIVSDITDICLAIERGIFISHLRIALYEKLNSQTVIFNLFSPPMATRNKLFFLFKRCEKLLVRWGTLRSVMARRLQHFDIKYKQRNYTQLN